MPRRAGLLRLYYFVFFSAVGAHLPFFPTWLRAQGIDGLAMSSVTALWPLLGVVSPIVFGVAADTLGLRGSLLRIAAVGAFVPFATLAALELTGVGVGYSTLFGLALVFAFFRAPMVTMADVTALEAPGSYGRKRLFGSAGFLVMAALAGHVIDPTARAELPTLIAAALGATLLVTLRLPARAPHPPTPVLDDALGLLRDPDYLLFLFGAFLWYAGHVSYDLCFSLHLKDLGASPSTIGWCWALGVVAEMALMGLGHRILSRFALIPLFTFALCAAAVRFLLIAHVRSLGVLFLLQPLHALSFALFWVTALQFVKQRAPAGVLATAQSLFSVATALGSAVGMFAWGPLYAKSGGATVFSAAAIVAVIGAGTAWMRGAVARREGNRGLLD